MNDHPFVIEERNRRENRRRGIGEIKKRKIKIWIDRDLTETEARVFFVENVRVDVIQCPAGYYRREDLL